MKHAILLNLDLPLLTPRLRLRAPEPGDGAALFDAVQETSEALRMWMPWARDPHYSVSHAEERCRTAAAKFLTREDLTFHIFERTTGQFLGGTGLHRMHWEKGIFEIGYWIRQSATGRGYVTEAVNDLTRFAFHELEARRVSIHCNVENQKSRAIPERLGFTLEGILRNHDRFAGPEITCRDEAIYARIDSHGLPS